MTNVIIIGEELSKKKRKKIKFIKHLNEDLIFDICLNEPHDYQYIELICKGYGGFDIMLAYENDRNCGTLYSGHFNDGVV